MRRCPKLTDSQKEELKNAIKQTKDSKEIRRAQAALLLDAQVDYPSITELTGFKERAVLTFRQRYLKHGLIGIRHKRKGKQKSLLSKVQRTEIIHFLTHTKPKEHGYATDYWTTAILGELIWKKYGVAYKTRKPFYLLFAEARLSFHKPGKVYEKRDAEKVLAWQREMKPKLQEALANPAVVVLCEDEMILSSQTTFQKVWLQKGEYPKLEVTNTKKNKSVYGFLNIKTGRCHSFMKDHQNMHLTVETLKEIRGFYPRQAILLLWDGAGWHKGSKVQEFLKADGNIEVIYFPPYSPEENPQEHVWKKARAAITHNKFISNIDEVTKQFVAFINLHSFHYKFLGFAAGL